MNHWTGIGRLTKDPDARTTASGVTVVTLNIAIDRRFKGKDGEKVTDFFTVVAWKGLADLCTRYLTKGQKIAVSGEVQNRSYEAKDGTKRYITEIVASDIEFLSPKSSEKPADALDGFTDVVDTDLPF